MKVTAFGCRTPAEESALGDIEGVQFVDDLCAYPGRLPAGEDADRLVLVLHEHDYVPAQIQRRARELNFDPLLVPIITWEDAAGDPDRLRVMIQGASARVAELADSTPQQAKPVLPNRMNRRTLLMLPQPVYVAVPEIDRAVCVAADGCKACVPACPEQAYTWIDGRLEYDKAACTSCGRCVTACPTGAIENPTVSAAAIRAAIAAMVNATSGPIGVAFTCDRRTRRAFPPNWYPLDVPCASMVPGTWPVAALMLGAALSSIVSCRDSGCPLGHDDVVGANIGFAKALLTAFDLDAELVSSDLARPIHSRFDQAPPSADVFGALGAHETIRCLSELVGRDVRVANAAAPTGVVVVDPETCTMCTMCSIVCPTRALSHDSDMNDLLLSFDAGRCTACMQCAATCPEIERGAIDVQRIADSTALTAGQVVLNRATTQVCDMCGASVAPQQMLDRIAALLGDGHTVTVDYLSRRCMNCRGS